MMHEKNEVKWNCFIATSSISPIEFTARKNNLDCSKIPIDENTTFILLWVKDAQIGDRAVISMKKLSHSSRLQDYIRAFFLSVSPESHWWEVFVEIEGQGIEFFTSSIAFEGSELLPPMLPTIFFDGTILALQCVVQKECYASRNKCFRWEWDINHIIELWE